MNSDIDGYEIRKDWLIGRGAFGAVYRARKDGKDYAMKVIRADILHPAMRKRLDNEIHAIQKVQHSNVVKLRTHGTFEDNSFEYVYIVMDLVEGKPLTSFVGSIDEGESKRIAKSILATLDSIHTDGIIHRDLKPDNIMIRNDGTPIILDLGLAKLVDYSSITQTGERLGTYYYMSPEQVTDSKNIDVRSDYFAVGIILYQLITGQLPYDATNLPALIEQIKNQYPANPSLLNPALSNNFENVILKMLEKDPFRRYQKASEIIDAINSKPKTSGRKLDLSYKFYLRMNHNDKSLMIDAHKDGILARIIYPASYFARNHPTVAELRKNQGLIFATDPATNRLSYSSFSKTKGVLELPYSSGSPVTPTSPEDFDSLSQVQAFVKNVLDYQVENGVDELAAPFFYARTTSDEWHEINIKLLRESLAYRDTAYTDRPLWASICMNVDGWYDKKEKTRILNEYTKVEADGYMVYGDPIGKGSNLTQLFHYSDLLLTLQESTNAPVITCRVNGLGLILMAFGLSGMSAGAASLDSFREDILYDKSEGYTNDPRYYIPELASMISLTKGTDAKIKDIQRTSIAEQLKCDCPYCRSINDGNVIASDTKKHYLYRRKKEIEELEALDAPRRIEYVLERMETAVTYEATLRKESVKLGDMAYLTTLRDLVNELKKR